MSVNIFTLESSIEGLRQSEKILRELENEQLVDCSGSFEPIRVREAAKAAIAERKVEVAEMLVDALPGTTRIAALLAVNTHMDVLEQVVQALADDPDKIVSNYLNADG